MGGERLNYERQPRQASLTTIAGVLPISKLDARFPVVSLQKLIFYTFSGNDQYAQEVAYPSGNYMADAGIYSLRYPWNPAHGLVAHIEAQITQAVGVDEEFEILPAGFVYGGSGLISLVGFSLLDDANAQKISFANGDTATKKNTTKFPATVGGVLITHVGALCRRLGSNTYPGPISIAIHSAGA